MPRRCVGPRNRRSPGLANVVVGTCSSSRLEAAQPCVVRAHSSTKPTSTSASEKTTVVNARAPTCWGLPAAGPSLRKRRRAPRARRQAVRYYLMLAAAGAFCLWIIAGYM